MAQSSHDRIVELITNRDATRAGAIQLSEDKRAGASRYVVRSRELRKRAESLASISAIMAAPDLYHDLIVASGFSDKAVRHLQPDDKAEGLAALETVLFAAGPYFVDELVARYLLGRGESLGGSMRNLIGRQADRKFMGEIMRLLTARGVTCQWRNRESSVWSVVIDAFEASSEGSALAWQGPKGHRLLLTNATVRNVEKNIDTALLSCRPEDIIAGNNVHHNPAFYLAVGELKGGNDPAGADEHWKTALTAFNRVREAFADTGRDPQTFFVGAAITGTMAKKLVSLIDRGVLNKAANLTKPDQLTAVCDWLVDL